MKSVLNKTSLVSILVSITFELPLELELFFMAESYGAPQRTYEVKLKMEGRRKIGFTGS